MKVTLSPSKTGGTIKAIASKSAAHRALICAAFADKPSLICCEETNEDICATVRCLNALGANIERAHPYFRVTPVAELKKGALLDCGESGSTLRFLLPIVAALGADASFVMSGRLPERPLSPLYEELTRLGVSLSEQGENPFYCKGRLTDMNFSIRGDVSSQFISGLLFAIAVSKRQGSVKITSELESAPYIDLTVDMLKTFGVSVLSSTDGYEIIKNGGLFAHDDLSVEGDWSNAAFPLALGAIGDSAVSVTDLKIDSRQGDRAIVDLLERFGAKISISENSVTVSPALLHGIEIDARQIPDLVPILATVASVAEGRTVIYNASRLRIKESDRLSAISEVLRSLGATIAETPDGLIIDGTPDLRGGEVFSFGDHRIAMSAAVASARCKHSVTIAKAEATAKSYPSFFDDMSRLGLDSHKD